MKENIEEHKLLKHISEGQPLRAKEMNELIDRVNELDISIRAICISVTAINAICKVIAKNMKEKNDVIPQ